LGGFGRIWADLEGNQMQKWINTALSILVFGSLAACMMTDGMIYQDWRHSFYSPDLARYAAKDGGMATVVLGDPFGSTIASGAIASGAKLSGKKSAELVAGLAIPAYLGNVPLVAVSAKNQPKGRLVLLFNPSQSTDSNDICREKPAATRDGVQNMEIQAIFCYGNLMVSEASMKMRRPKGPESSRYQRNMSNLVTILLPSRGPNSGGCPSKGGC
jgi:hypothetical protein